MLKIIDLNCKSCNHTFEMLVDKSNELIDLDSGESIKCPKCSSVEVKPQLGTSSSNAKHPSWSKW